MLHLYEWICRKQSTLLRPGSIRRISRRRLAELAQRSAFDKRRTGAAPGTMDALLAHAEDRHRVVAVHRDSRKSVSLGAVTQILPHAGPMLAVCISIAATVNREDHGQPIRGSNLGSLMPRAERGKTVAAEHQYHIPPPLLLVGARHPPRQGELSRKRSGWRKDVASCVLA